MTLITVVKPSLYTTLKRSTLFLYSDTKSKNEGSIRSERVVTPRERDSTLLFTLHANVADYMPCDAEPEAQRETSRRLPWYGFNLHLSKSWSTVGNVFLLRTVP